MQLMAHPPAGSGMIGQNEGFCKVKVPYRSPGLWSLEAANGFLGYALPRLQLQLAVIFLLTQCLHFSFRPLKFQRVVAEILAGIILGPSIMGKISPTLFQSLFPDEGDIYIDLLSKIGYVFFMFIAGVQMELSTVSKSGRKAWTIGFVSVMIPIVVGTTMSLVFYCMLPLYYEPAAKAIVGIQTLTPFAVVACLLIDLEIINSELGRLALAATLISDVVSSVFTTGIRFILVGWSLTMALQSLVLSISSILVILAIGRPIFSWIIKQTPEGKPVKGVYIVLVSLIVMISAVISDIVGLQYQFCPLILGLVVPSGPPLGTTLVERLGTLASGLFAPLIVTTCGLKFDAFELYDLDFLRTVWIIFALTAGLKVISVLLSGLLCRMPLRDATVLSIIMSAQGIVELALYQNYFMNQTIDEETFAAATISVLFTDIFTTRLIRSLYDYSRKYTGYQNRDIQNLAPNGEFRILACTHRQDDALSAIKLLEISNPTKESPIVACALNLVELFGQASPLLINHDLGQKWSSLGFRSAKIIDVFRNYKEQHPRLITIQAFTAMSLPRFMQEDICSLAFNKMASIIILPFHRKWNQQSRLVLDSGMIRTINRHVLDMAPCSVGILIDRNKTSPSSNDSSVYRIAVIFLEGEDDREALAYGLRMAGSPGIHLSVVRLMARDDMAEDEWETILDTECLKRAKFESTIHPNNVSYIEEMTNDGSETAMTINQLAEDFDFIIVGRRHRDDSRLLSGLMEWCELSELGSLADMLASTDVKNEVSVLVVQHQKNRTEDKLRRQTTTMGRKR